MIYAFDKSLKRCSLLEKRVKEAAADNLIEVSNRDFLSIKVEDYLDVKCILTDPSCSGSGVVRSIERLSDQKNDKKRLESLRQFQAQCVLKAMSFPSAEIIVYSTCSIHQEENESVVAEVLQRCNDLTGNIVIDYENRSWELVEPRRFSGWSRRGDSFPLLSPEQSKNLIRVSPEDGMNGFFVALFRRKVGNCKKYLEQISNINDSNKNIKLSQLVDNKSKDSIEATRKKEKENKQGKRESRTFLGQNIFRVAKKKRI